LKRSVSSAVANRLNVTAKPSERFQSAFRLTFRHAAELRDKALFVAAYRQVLDQVSLPTKILRCSLAAEKSEAKSEWGFREAKAKYIQSLRLA